MTGYPNSGVITVLSPAATSTAQLSNVRSSESEGLPALAPSEVRFMGLNLRFDGDVRFSSPMITAIGRAKPVLERIQATDVVFHDGSLLAPGAFSIEVPVKHPGTAAVDREIIGLAFARIAGELTNYDCFSLIGHQKGPRLLLTPKPPRHKLLTATSSPA